MEKKKKPHKSKSLVTLLRKEQIIIALGLGALQLRKKTYIGHADYEVIFMYERDSQGRHTDLPSQVRIEIIPQGDSEIISKKNTP